jgi:hypothetical protein
VNGFFVRNIRRNNFAVVEDGARQRNASVEVEHSPIAWAVLMKMGGRSQLLNKALRRLHRSRSGYRDGDEWLA